jgi:(p)ppGpp synthase/HD superfamily hydrolase
MYGMSLGECYDDYEKLLGKAAALVRSRIKGTRKGLPGDLNYTHSFRVYDIVMKLHHWDDPDFELFLAALLHDIVEDGNTSFEELAEMGFSGRTIELIYLCTYNKEIKNKTERWTLMMAKLIKARDEEAWCIKLADLSDNLTQSGGLTEENSTFMIEAKAPLMLRLTEWLTGYSWRYHVYLKTSLENLHKETAGV